MGRTIDKYYTVTEHLMGVYDKQARSMAAPSDSTEAVKSWQEEARAKFHELLHLDGFEKCDPAVTVLETEQMDGYKRERFLLQTEPDVWMPVYALIPDDLKEGEKRPAFISPHGHGPAQFGNLGLYEYDGMQPMLARMKEWAKANPEMAEKEPFPVTLAKAGYLVFAPEARGAGSRREAMTQGDENFSGNSHQALNNIAMSLGYSVAGMMAWDNMRLVDYILSREDCDGRVGVGGMSGGGHQSLFLAAADPRIQLCITSGWFYGFKESFLLLPMNCSCNFVPNLWKFFDCCDLGSLVAPRPLHVESGRKDGLAGTVRYVENASEQVRLTRKTYDLLGEGDRLLHYIHEGGHMWDGKYALDFVKQYMPLQA